MKEIREFKLPDITISAINDGEYEGSNTISRWAMTAKVTVKDRKIISIALVKNMKSSMPAALVTKINQKVIEKQSPDIDAVSGVSILQTGNILIIKKS
jgi:uncharacterized protein with FMN-binding domain